MTKSREIIDIFADIARGMDGVDIIVTGYDSQSAESKVKDVNYIFGSAQYFKDRLDELSRTGTAFKFPALVLFCPVQETRNDPDYYSKAKVNLLIACGSQQQWSNEQRKSFSFENVLRPLYRRMLALLAADSRLDFGYASAIKHEYSENYSYGRYGAYVDRSGEAVSEPIDAIDIRNLELKIKPLNCRI